MPLRIISGIHLRINTVSTCQSQKIKKEKQVLWLLFQLLQFIGNHICSCFWKKSWTLSSMPWAAMATNAPCLGISESVLFLTLCCILPCLCLPWIACEVSKICMRIIRCKMHFYIGFQKFTFSCHSVQLLWRSENEAAVLPLTSRCSNEVHDLQSIRKSLLAHWLLLLEIHCTYFCIANEFPGSVMCFKRSRSLFFAWAEQLLAHSGLTNS